MILPKSAILSAPMSAESQLVTRARAGDPAAREELAQEHRRAAYFLALQLLGNPDDALDVAQDAMLRLFMSLNRFDSRRPVRPWLFQIVRNRVVDLYRRRKVRAHDSLDALYEDGTPRHDVPDESVDVERDAQRSELRARIWKALAQLTQAQREIIVLRDYQDLAYSEIAATLSIPIGTVMSRLHSARKALRRILIADPDFVVEAY